MTDPNYTALLLIVDRSGSMESIRHDMVGGLTAMLATQSAAIGRLTVDVVTFDDMIEFPHTMADPVTVTIELVPRGMTALHDAVGLAVTRFGASLAAMPEETRPDTVQVVVVTDGQENASREFSADSVRDLVTAQTENYGWDFVFLGANQDAVLADEALGIAADSSLTFVADPLLVGAASESLNRYVTDVRGKSRKGFSSRERDSAVR
jgi:Mg-chelatase subunit ChlD